MDRQDSQDRPEQPPHPPDATEPRQTPDATAPMPSRAYAEEGAPRAPAIALLIAAVAGAGLGITSSTYLSQNASCGGGLGRIGIGMGILNMLACIWPLTGGLALYSLVVALRRRQWSWVTVLLATAAAGVGITSGSSSAVAHDAVVAILGVGCGASWSDVALFVAPLLIALVCFAYFLRDALSA